MTARASAQVAPPFPECHASAPLIRPFAISSSPSMQFAYTRSSTSTECPARRATVGAGTPLAGLTPEVRATLSSGELFVREYVASGPMYWYDPTYDCSWLWEGVAPDWPIVERLFELFETYDLAKGPAEITVPVLIAHGRYDYAAPYTLWDDHRHKLPRHTYALFDRSGHYPPLEEPQRFEQKLFGWVHGLDSSGG